MHARVDDNTCIGCELCASTCPAVFKMNDSDIAEVTADPVPADAEDNCREAAVNCPVEAIALEE
jgi:ferredoxin